LFDPLDVHAMAQKIHQSLTDSVFRAQLVANAQVQARKFSWDASARQAIQAIESAVQRPITDQIPAQPPIGTLAETPPSLLRAAVQVLQKHRMLSDHDVDSLAACMAQNEQQLGLPMPTEMTPPN